jgi:hypothetical protein
VNHLARIQEHLPGPYALARDAVLTQVLDVMALELEAFDEDLDRMRQTHWIRFVYTLADAEKLSALVGVKRLPWENLTTFRTRLLPLVEARLDGALGPQAIKRFVYEYIRGIEDALSDAENKISYQLVPGLKSLTCEQSFRDAASEPPVDRPLFRFLELEENPERPKTSRVLVARSGRVPYLYRWEENNNGLSETIARFRITGRFGGRTTVPVLVNETTGDLLGYSGPIAFGQTLIITQKEGTDGLAQAILKEVDVTSRLFSMKGFALGVPFTRDDLDAAPRLPRMARGANRWIFLAVGLYNVKGLNHFFFSIAGKELREGMFDETFFNQALFPSGDAARVEMGWVETEPASFEVKVPRFLVIEPATIAAGNEGRTWEHVAEGLQDAVRQLHAAGVKAQVRFVPFVETQRQKARVRLPWIVTEPQSASPGTGDTMTVGGRFGESSLGGSRFE